ncbi:MAG: YhgE/Pip domain-containing protein [Oscillospiraceae bacterium]|nr:YhgE/Pip domain-containing protein [Oscillospiraceae bacterium]
MRNIFKIFFSDLRAIFSHFFAAVILLVALVLPALYAWVNIYANWDPYGNTGNVPILLASRDLGYTLENGEYVNRGREIIEEVAESTSIKWIIFEDADRAIEEVRAGHYYGALVMGEHLSRNMYELTTALEDKEPSIVFYQNAKTNAIANKITTTAATTVEHNIQVKYLSVLIQQFMENVEDLLEKIDGEASIDHLVEMLTRLRNHTADYAKMVANLRASQSSLIGGLDTAGQVLSGVNVGDSAARTAASRDSVTAVKQQVMDRLAVIDTQIVTLRDQVAAAQAAPEALTEAMLASYLQQTQAIEAEIEALRSTLPSGSLVASGVAASMQTLLIRAQSLEATIKTFQGHIESAAVNKEFLTNALTQLNEMKHLIDNNLKPSYELLFDTMIRDLEVLTNILSSVNTTVADVQPVLSAAKGTIYAADGTMAQLQRTLEQASLALDKLLEKAILARDSDMMEDLIELLHGEPRQFAEFFSNPVEVTTETIYPVENYGTAMTPFYSTLAIWVGCVVTGAIIKAEAEAEHLPRLKERHLYWGRFLTFLLISQIQAAIIVAGDIYLLGCQCLYPKLFFLTGAVTSLAFTALIYSLTLAFGDVGKAIVVVIMVLQIAGSSGSYPIEILPPIFAKIYLFFPFPYAINAMRETLCGLYRLDLVKYLAELMVFGVIGVLIGLEVRKPFIGVNKFIEEEMEETGVL